MQSAPNRFEVAAEVALIETRRAAEHPHVGARTVADFVQIALGDGFDVKKTTAHGGHVADRFCACVVGQVGQHALAHDEVKLLPSAPLGDIAHLVAVLGARASAYVGRPIKHVGHLLTKPSPPNTRALPALY